MKTEEYNLNADPPPRENESPASEWGKIKEQIWSTWGESRKEKKTFHVRRFHAVEKPDVAEHRSKGQ